MNFKRNITLDGRIGFVNAVMNICSIDGNYEPALFDYAFRVAILMYFTDEDILGKDSEALNEIVYTSDFNDIMNQDYVIDSLYSACRERISIAREQTIAKYNVEHDPLTKIADAIEAISKQFDMEAMIKQIAAENAKRPIVVGNPEDAKKVRAEREAAKKKAQDAGLKVLANPKTE